MFKDKLASRATLLTGFLALLSIASIGSVNFYTRASLNDVAGNWHGYVEDSAEISASVIRLQAAIGYGGFIHNHKNYVLRRESGYLDSLLSNAGDIASEIQFLRAKMVSPEARQALDIIQKTFDRYVESLMAALADGGRQEIGELDRLVKVSDREALAAFQVLSNRIEEKRRAQTEASEASIATSRMVIDIGSGVIFLIVMMTGVQFIIARRLDIAQRSTQNALNHARALFSNSPIAIFVISADGRILEINPEAEKLFGYRQDELEGQGIEKLLPAEEQSHYLERMRAFISNPQSSAAETGGLLKGITRDGAVKSVEVSLSRGRESEKQIIAAVRDVSKERRLIAELKDATALANSANTAKSEFLASMSHEIRTPLNGILGIIQLIEQQDLNADVRKKIKVARESGFFLLALINQLLDFSRIEAGKIETFSEAFSLEALLDGFSSMFRTVADQKKIEYSVLIPDEDVPDLMGDFPHIRQVLFNLVGNALKFTETGSVTLEARFNSTRNKTPILEFTVSDTGPGIPDDMLDLVFERFGQTELGRFKGGTGLGLSISRQLADLMGGSLDVLSEVGKGSRFIFRVPLEIAPSDQNLDQADRSGPVVPDGMNVLVVEDNPVNQMVVSGMLEGDGHKVTVRSNGRDGMRIAIEMAAEFDVVLMDIQMPEMDGVAAVRKIRQAGITSEVLPIIALTANAFREQREAYLEAGMQDVLTKPLRLAELRTFLGRYAKPGEQAFAKAGAEEPVTGGPAMEDKILDDAVISEVMRSIPADMLQSLFLEVKQESVHMLGRLETTDLARADIIFTAHRLCSMLANFGLKGAAKIAADIERQDYSVAQRLERVRAIRLLLKEGMASIEEKLDFVNPVG